MQPYNLLKLVQRHGQTLTLDKVTTAGDYNPSTGTIGGTMTVTDPVTGITTTTNFDSDVVGSYEITAYMYDVSEGILLNDITRGTRRCVIPALGLPVEPEDGDRISGNGDKVSIVRVTTHFSAGIAVCYVCEVSE